MQYTNKLGLKKPDLNDYVNVSDLNENMDILDHEISKITDEETGVEAKLTEHLADTIRHFDYAVASGTNSYTVTIPGIDELVEGMSVKIKFTNANTGASTLNINGLGAKSIRKGNGNTLSSGNIKAGQICHLVYTGSTFQLLGEGGEYGTATAADVVNTKTFGTENGVIQGALDLTKYKKWASGNAISNSVEGTYITPSSTITATGLYKLTVTGLDFTPNTILIYSHVRYAGVTIFYPNDIVANERGAGRGLFRIMLSAGAGDVGTGGQVQGVSTFHIQNVSPVSVMYGRFDLPVYSPNTEYQWIAFA